MTNKELKEMVEMLRGRGMSDEDIAGTAYMMFADEKLSLDELRAFLQAVDMDIPDDLLSLSEEELRTKFRREVLGTDFAS